jgi:hypothetical protein
MTHIDATFEGCGGVALHSASGCIRPQKVATGCATMLDVWQIVTDGVMTMMLTTTS